MVSEENGASAGGERLRRFLHEVSAPLSAVAFQLEAASRRAAKGEDPSAALAAAREHLNRAFDLFERGRAELLEASDRRAGRQR